MGNSDDGDDDDDVCDVCDACLGVTSAHVVVYDLHARMQAPGSTSP